MNVPIYNALRGYLEERNILLHMPGHKGGTAFPQMEFRQIGALDFTEIPGLDDLHLPAGILLEAQHLAARAWGAEKSLFLVNGATSGIHSLLLAMGPQARVLLPRNAHRSIVEGLILSGGWPEFIDCEIDSDLQIALSVTPRKVAAKLDSCPEISGAFLVSPTYYGTVNEVRAIARLLAKRGIPLMVDEAHGAHLVFHPGYPPSALQEGAGASVHGLHKTLPALTQTGLLHLAGNFSWEDKVQACHSLLTTTSPSYPLMASIDIGRAIMERDGQALLERARELRVDCQLQINKIKGLRVRDDEYLQVEGVAGYDPLKVLVEITELDTTGVELSYLLRRRYGIQVELAGEKYVLAMFSPFNQPDDWTALASALTEASRQFNHKLRPKKMVPDFPPIPPLAMTPRESFLSRRKTVMIKESEGLIAAEMAVGYPPGIPCLIPGEVITAEVIEYLEHARRSGISVHGLRDRELKTIQVVDKQ